MRRVQARVRALAVREHLRRPDIVLVSALAVGLRLLVAARSPGGFAGNFGYDVGVYYSASDALVHGRVPYQDFTLLHPPAVMLALSPFAVIGRLTSDHVGFVVGNLAFAVLGGINAALVVSVARRMLLGRFAALLAGLTYAVWLASIGAEFSSRLEPLGNFFTLLGLLALVSDRRRPRRWLPAAAGVGFAAAASVKIWWLAPLAVIILWHALVDRSLRRVLALAGGAVLSILAIDGPFLALAPSQMAHLVVLDQLRRPRGTPIATRLSDVIGLTNFSGAPLSRTVAFALSSLLIATVVLTCALAWRRPPARLFAVLTVVQLGVLVAGPSWATYYADFLVVPFCLTGAAAAATIVALTRAARRRTTRDAVTVMACLPLAVLAVATVVSSTQPYLVSSSFSARRLSAAVARSRCVLADAPIALIELNVLSRDLARGCPNWIDVSGRTYGVDAAAVVNGRRLPRRQNLEWQADLCRYLTSGDAVILVRSATGISAATLRAVTRGGVLASEGGHSVYRTAPATAGAGSSVSCLPAAVGAGLAKSRSG